MVAKELSYTHLYEFKNEISKLYQSSKEQTLTTPKQTTILEMYNIKKIQIQKISEFFLKKTTRMGKKKLWMKH